FIIPEFGFTTDGRNKSAENSKKPKKSYTGSVLYLDNGDNYLGPDEMMIDSKQALIESYNDDELLILNENNFFICPSCGYTEISETTTHDCIERNHHTKTGYPCNKQLERTNIGYILKTDVTKITMSFPGYAQNKLRDKATSLLYALL